AAGGSYTQIGTAGAPPYTDFAVTNGATFYYVVRAVQETTSPASNEVHATAVATPTNVVATAGTGQIVLTWSACAGATVYSVKRSITSGSGFTVVGSPSSASYTDAGRTNGTVYYYLVSATNASGQSVNSSQVSATPIAQPYIVHAHTYLQKDGVQLYIGDIS